MPAKQGDDEREVVRVGDERRQGAFVEDEADVRPSPVHLAKRPKRKAAVIPTGKPTASAVSERRATSRRRCTIATQSAGERAELGADDHRADDQDRRAEHDPDRGDQAGEDHEGEEVGAQLDRSRRCAPPPPPRRPRRRPSRGWRARPGRRRRRSASRSPRARSSPRSTTPSSRRSSITTLASSRATSQRITSPGGLRAAPSSSARLRDRGRRFEQVDDALAKASRERRSAGAPCRQRIRAQVASRLDGVLTDYHLHLRPDEPDTPPERYFTAENVERYLEAAASRRDRGARRLRARLPLRRGARALAPSVLAGAGKRRPRRLLRVRPQDARCRLGIECDFVPGAEDRTAALLEARDFDYVVGSVHFVGEAAVDHEGWDVWEGGGDADEIWRRYFEALAECARSGLFDILAHPDLVKVWGRGRPLPERDPRFFYEPAVEAIAGKRDRGRGLDRRPAQARRRTLPGARAAPRSASRPASPSRSPPTPTCPSRSASATSGRSSCWSASGSGRSASSRAGGGDWSPWAPG